MLKRFSLQYVLLSVFLDVGLVMAAFSLASYLRQTLPYGNVQFNPRYPQGLLPQQAYGLAALLWVVTGLTVSLYDSKKIYKAVDEFQTLTLTLGFYTLGIAGVLYFTFRDTSRMLVFYALALTWIALISWRALARIWMRTRHQKPARVSHVLIVGAGEVGQRVAAMIHTYAWAGLELVGYLDDDPAKRGNGLPVLGTLEDVEAVVQAYGIDDVVMTLPPKAHEGINLTVSRLHKLPVRVRVVPDYFSLALYRATVDDFGGIPMINLRDPVLSPQQRILKRLLDLMVGGLLTLLFLPVMGAIAVAIKLDSPGPLLFKQLRVGENGRLFEMYKFRSMVEDAERLQKTINVYDENGNTVHKQREDPRVTRVGRFIRRLSLDELPQFFNVLKGDMSLIGPRPELPWLVEKYEPWQRGRFAVPQGLTGWWQVNGRSGKLMHLHTDEDLYYIQNYSLWLDLYILLKTPLVVLRGRGAF